MNITHKISLDLVKGGAVPKIIAVQNDKLGHEIELSLYADDGPWIVPSGVTAVVHYAKADGNGGSYDTLPEGSPACRIVENVLTVVLAPQVCTASGIARLAVSMMKGAVELNTFAVLIHVHPNPQTAAVSGDAFQLSGVLPYSGWAADMYLGTDERGNVVTRPVPAVNVTVETITVGGSGGSETAAVTGLSLDLTSYSAKAGDGFYLNPVILPSDAANKAVTWSSDAPGVAAVDSSGYVECIAAGEAVITCTTVDGGFTATCAVSVAAAESGETAGQKIRFSTLELVPGGYKSDGTAHVLGSTYHVTIPYTEGMVIRTLWNGSWDQGTYPAMLAAADGTYYTPEYTVGETMSMGGKVPSRIDAVLTGYPAGSSVIVGMLIGSTNAAAMDNTDYLYYIPGGEA